VGKGLPGGKYADRHPWRFWLTVTIVGGAIAGVVSSTVTTGFDKGPPGPAPDDVRPTHRPGDGAVAARVSRADIREWDEIVRVDPGSVVSVVLAYKNDTDQVVQDMTVRAELPTQVEMVPRSIVWSDANHLNEELSDGALSSGGVNLGAYRPVAEDQVNGVIRFRLHIAPNRNSAVCGKPAPLTILAFLRKGDAKEEVRDDATILVERPCVVP
jgi:hypothetical protein